MSYLQSRCRWLAIVLMWTGSGSTAVAADLRLFVSAMLEQKVLSLSWDEERRSLDRLGSIELPGQPAALATSRDGRRLFVSLRSTGQLAAVEVAESGELTLLNVVDAGADPAQITLDATGRWLLAAYYVAGKVTVHAVDRDGRLSAEPHQELKTTEKAHAIVLDPTQQFAFIPHTGGESIFQFAWDAEAGKLTPLTIDRRKTSPGTGPRHLVWRRQGDVAYVSNEQASSTTAWLLEPTTGLTPIATASTLPPDFEGPNSTAEIKLHPSGRTLYVANRGHDSLAVIEVSEDGRQLTPVGYVRTEKTPRSFDVERSGKWLFVAGEGTGQLAVYELTNSGRNLKLSQSLSLAQKLWWVHVAD